MLEVHLEQRLSTQPSKGEDRGVEWMIKGLDEEKRVKLNNIFSKIPYFMQDEISETLLKAEHFKLERIISSGQATPPGEWFDQNTNEWVILLSGSAGLRFDDEEEVCAMYPGDYVHVPAHKRHRVEWTDPEQKTVWLALHH